MSRIKVKCRPCAFNFSTVQMYYILAKDGDWVSFEPLGTLRVKIDNSIVDVHVARQRWRELREQGYQLLSSEERWKLIMEGHNLKKKSTPKQRLRKSGWNPAWGSVPQDPKLWWMD